MLACGSAKSPLVFSKIFSLANRLFFAPKKFTCAPCSAFYLCIASGETPQKICVRAKKNFLPLFISLPPFRLHEKAIHVKSKNPWI